jgi:hypothetical protein
LLPVQIAHWFMFCIINQCFTHVFLLHGTFYMSLTSLITNDVGTLTSEARVYG